MKVAIVNDMRMCQEVLARLVSLDPDCQIIWSAYDGADAVRKCAAAVPDLLIMDLYMPVMDGAEATRRIMASTPCAILIVTASVDSCSAKVFETLGAGALDAVKTPSIGADGKMDGAEPFIRKLSQFKQLLKPAKSSGKASGGQKPDFSGPAGLVVVGSSTGGPNALADLLSQIPAEAPAAFVVVQHVDRQFAPGLATWLESQCRLEVRVAKPGDVPRKGVVLIAGTNDHMIASCDKVLQYVAEPVDNPFRPSVDVFFNSVSCKSCEKGIAVLLTGIGRDGAAGLLALRHAGWTTFAQSKESCVVFGMPKAAIELDAADEVLAPKEIGARIAEILLKKRALQS